MKSYSSIWIHLIWTTKESPPDIDKVQQYIINQEEHHKHWKLDEEIERFKQYDDE